MDASVGIGYALESTRMTENEKDARKRARFVRALKNWKPDCLTCCTSPSSNSTLEIPTLPCDSGRSQILLSPITEKPHQFYAIEEMVEKEKKACLSSPSARHLSLLRQLLCPDLTRSPETAPSTVLSMPSFLRERTSPNVNHGDMDETAQKIISPCGNQIRQQHPDHSGPNTAPCSALEMPSFLREKAPTKILSAENEENVYSPSGNISLVRRRLHSDHNGSAASVSSPVLKRPSFVIYI